MAVKKSEPAKATKATKTTKTENEETTAIAPKRDLAALAAKANAAKDADAATRSADGVNVQFISLCQSQAKALDEDDALHIPGIKQKDFYIQAKKIRFGPRLTVVPLAFLTVYTEYSQSGNNGKFLGIWHKEDALQYPLCVGHFFNRELPNGHELRPAHWVLVYLPDHPEIERAVITFKSTGNKVAKAWNKEVDARGTSCQLIYELSSKGVSNDSGKWNEVTYDFQGYVYETEPKFKIIEDYAEEVIEKSLEYNTQYQKGVLVPRRAAGAMNSQRVLPGTSPFEEADDDDEDAPAF